MFLVIGKRAPCFVILHQDNLVVKETPTVTKHDGYGAVELPTKHLKISGLGKALPGDARTEINIGKLQKKVR